MPNLGNMDDDDEHLQSLRSSWRRQSPSAYGISVPEWLPNFTHIGLSPDDVHNTLLALPGVTVIDSVDLARFASSIDSEMDYHIWIIAPGKIIKLYQPHGITTETIKAALIKTRRRFRLHKSSWDGLNHYQWFIQSTGAAVRVHIKGSSVECIAMGMPSAAALESLEKLSAAIAMSNFAIEYFTSSGDLRVFQSAKQFAQFVQTADI